MPIEEVHPTPRPASPRTSSHSPQDAGDSAVLSELDAFDYQLPDDRIAQHPAQQRDQARLLVLDRASSADSFEHARVRDLASRLQEGDLLVVNATRVLPARLRGRRQSGGAAEALLLGPANPDDSGAGGLAMRALVRISGRVRPGIRFTFGPEDSAIKAEITALCERGEVVLSFPPGVSPYSVGEPPLPPYIRRRAATDPTTREEDQERYQTIYAHVPGAIAAPTAGLHFSETLFHELEQRGVERAEVVLHVGPGTFRPLDAEALRTGRLHQEVFELPEATADAIARTRTRGGRVVAVGTTSVRVLESNADIAGGARGVRPGRGTTDLFLKPGARFQVVDALLTNFHLPRSSLLLLVAAFAGRERVLAAYREALARDYRFFSYGDAMLIL